MAHYGMQYSPCYALYLTWYLYHERDIQPSKELIRKRAISKFSKHRINLEAHMEIIYVLKGKV